MPTYQVTDSKSGVTLKLTGDSPPTEQELVEIFASVQQGQPEQAEVEPEILGASSSIAGPQEPAAETEKGFISSALSAAANPVRTGRGVLEAGAAIASGVIAEPIAGLAGIAGAVLPGERGQGARAVEATREALTFRPRTDSGQDKLQTVGEGLSFVGEGLQSAREGVGDAAFNIAKSSGASDERAAAIGAVGQASVDATAMALTAGLPLLARGAKATTQAAKNLVRPGIKAKLLAGVNDATTAKFTLNSAGNVVRATPAIKAIKQGFDKGVVGNLGHASKTDAKGMLKMLKIRERAMKDPLFGMSHRSTDIVGRTLSKRVNHVIKTKKIAGREIDTAANRLKTETVDIRDAVRKFGDELQDSGVGYDPATKKLLFRGSDFQGLTGPERSLQGMVQRMFDDPALSASNAHAAHRLKRFIDENVTFGKAAEGLGGQAENILKGLRHNINKALIDKFGDYAKANLKYHDTITVLDDFQIQVGRKLNLQGPNVEQALGQEARKLMSNYKVRIRMEDSINSLDDVAAKYGGKFDDNIKLQSMYANELDRKFGAEAQRGFQKEIEKGIGQAIKTSPEEAAIDATFSAGKRLFGKTDEKALKAMRDLLKSQQ